MRALVTGSAVGLGALIVDELVKHGHEVYGYDIKNGQDILDPRGLPEKLDILVNNAGANQIDWLADAKEEDWDRVVDINAKGIFMMTRACLPQLRESKGTVVNVVSNAAHKPMRCSAAYNASKGAAKMLTLQLARELAPDITVFSVSPNKLANTEMTSMIDKRVVETRGWAPEFAMQYQLDGLLPGIETDPARCAEFIGFLLSEKARHIHLAGCDLQYGV